MSKTVKSAGVLLLCLVCVLSGTGAAAAGQDGGVRMRTEHVAYVSGVPGGYFEPNRFVTRAEAAKMLWGLIDPETAPAASASGYYSDVAVDAWFYTAVTRLAATGAFRAQSGMWRPGDMMTRGEFADMVVRTLGLSDTICEKSCPFTDISQSVYRQSILVLYENGWAHGYTADGKSCYGPDKYLTRAEAVTLLNRIQGRGPLNFETVTDDAVMFKDNVDMSAWYYYEILEAATSHEHVLSESGFEFWTKVE